MKAFGFLIILAAVFLSACSLGSTLGGQQDGGIVWEVNVDAPITAGIERDQSGYNLYFADNNNNIYCMDSSAGSIRWKKQAAVGETVKIIYPSLNYLYVLTTSGTDTKVWRYSLSDGTLDTAYTTALGMVIKDGYTVDTTANIIVHSLNTVKELSLEPSLSVSTTVTSLPNIISVVKGTAPDFYAISGDSTVVKLSSPTSPVTIYSGATFKGAALFNGSLYAGTSAGIFKIDSSLTVSGTPVTFSIAYSPLVKYLYDNTIFAASDSGALHEIGRYDTAANLNTVQLYSANGPVTYSPVAVSILSSSAMAVSVVDENGYLNVFDLASGKLYDSRFIGNISKPYLKIGQDSYQKFLYVPVSVPAKVTCYSVDFAVHHY